MRAAVATLGALAALALTPLPASAAIGFTPCAGTPGVQCGTLPVPLDRSGHDPGTIDLHVERVPARQPSGPPIIYLAGGPGQTNTDQVDRALRILRPLLPTRDLVIFDQRGTGRSGAIHCS